MDTSTKILIVEDNFIEANHLRLMLKNAGYSVLGIARSVPDAKENIRKEKPGLVLLDIFLMGKETGIDLAKFLKEENIGFIYLSANSGEDILSEAKASHPYGFLVKPFREKDLLIMMQIAGYHQKYNIESSVRKEQLFQRQLKNLVSNFETWDEYLQKICTSLQPLIPFDLMVSLYMTDDQSNNILFGFLRTGFNEYQKITLKGFQELTDLKLHELIDILKNTITEENIRIYDGKDFQQEKMRPALHKITANFLGMKSNLTLPIPLSISKKGKFIFSFYSKNPLIFDDAHVEICKRLQDNFIYNVENIIAQQNENSRITETLKTSDNGFEGIIGKSPVLLSVFDFISQVAPTDTTVLITGESGTGKEKIANAIHSLSSRQHQSFIKINCASLPASLIESELFGHEKGSFTGALSQHIGKFEKANNGTLFLDEIGEIPLEIQVKLLRVLQEKEIERVGSNKSIKVDIRIIAATNRNLEKEVAEGRFRLDLYYRLCVFPLQLPALRERKEDIGILAQYFIKKFCEKLGKNELRLSPDSLKSLLTYNWPGNIRELENLIERSVILTKGDDLIITPLPATITLKNSDNDTEIWQDKTIEENERIHILNVLNKCDGRIRGEQGAAKILGVPPTTLASKMLKLGIKRNHY
ncbi:sigma 54-interacting transcriptional regulator [Chryseobacterium sp. MMS23-Vi53]|uniref:sigma 54-interacting transcriptional regulator n=1 Tax=Chryseobacterium sp. MMS23-Vi53 TaxID=3386644 RepID=UPI0039E76EF9